jgi:hypothetical protein
LRLLKNSTQSAPPRDPGQALPLLPLFSIFRVGMAYNVEGLATCARRVHVAERSGAQAAEGGAALTRCYAQFSRCRGKPIRFSNLSSHPNEPPLAERELTQTLHGTARPPHIPKRRQ